MNVRGLAKGAAAGALMVLLPLNAVAAQTVRASQALPSTTVAINENVRPGAALPGQNFQTTTDDDDDDGGFPFLIVLALILIGTGAYIAINGGSEDGDGSGSGGGAPVSGRV